MTKIVVDTNIIFSTFLNINSRIGQILITGTDYFAFYSPEYVKIELIKYKEKIKSIAKLSENEFIEIYDLVFRNINITNHALISFEIY